MSLKELVNGLPRQVLITGGAGFIGSHFADAMVADGISVTVLDDGSNACHRWLSTRTDQDRIEFVNGSVLDPDIVNTAVRDQDLVVHFAANAHIDRGVTHPRVDIGVSTQGTQNVLEAMRTHQVPEIMFASSGAVYGDLGRQLCSEAAGPLTPLSLYGAGKVAAEALLASYASLFGVRAWAYRFGNVLGTRMSRGAIHDFLERLERRPDLLSVLGDGKQQKSYFLVEHCLEGMLWIRQNMELSDDQPYGVFNLGSSSGTSVAEIARVVLEEFGLPELPLAFRGGQRAFPGDQPVVRLDTSMVSSAGWQPPISSSEATRTAVRRIIAWRRGEGL